MFLVLHFIFIPVYFLELYIFAAKRKILSRALLWVPYVFILSNLLMLDELWLLALQPAEQCRWWLESWEVPTAFIKTFSSLFSQLRFFLRLFSGSGFGDCTRWSVLQATNLRGVQRLFYFIARSLCSTGENACMEFQGSHAQTWIFQAVWTLHASIFSPGKWG